MPALGGFGNSQLGEDTGSAPGHLAADKQTRAWFIQPNQNSEASGGEKVT